MAEPAENITDKVERFLDKTGMAATTFGLKAVNSGNLVSSLRKGRAPRAVVTAKIATFIKAKESEFQRALGSALRLIKEGDGYVQIDAGGEPVNLPDGIGADVFRQLVHSGQLVPSGDSFLGGRPQTFRPI